MSTPELRFKNAQGHYFLDWSERTLGQVCKINQGLQIPIAERFSESGTNRYFYITNEFLRKDSDKRYFIENPPASVLCNKDDILMTRTGNTGKVVTDVSGAFHNNFFKIKYERDLLNKTFLCEFLSLDKTQSLILKLAGTSTIPDLNHGDFYRIKIHLPELEEQNKIAKLLTAVVEKITLLTQKYELLAQYKKGVMQQLFSQELRFKDDDGRDFPEWEDKVLGDITEMNSGGTPKSTIPDFYDGGIPWVSIADMTKQGKYVKTTERTISELGLKSSSARLYPVNTVLYAMYASIGECSIASLEVCSSQAILGIRPSKILRYDFLYQYLVSLKEVIKLQGQQGTQSNLNQGMVKDFKIELPTLKEQAKIAKFLTVIDDKLSHTQNQLTAAKQYKQGLLQQMFV